MTVYNKLVRDSIPKIISDQGKLCKIRVIEDDGEFKVYLYQKLMEEVAEFKDNPSLEEAADVMEVFEKLLEVHGLDKYYVSRARLDKIMDKGAFQRKIVLEEVFD